MVFDHSDKGFDGTVVKSSRSDFDVKFDDDGEVVTVEPDKHKFKRLPASPEAGGQHELEQQADEEPVHGEDDPQSQEPELQRKRDQDAAFGTAPEARRRTSSRKTQRPQRQDFVDISQPGISLAQPKGGMAKSKDGE